MTKEEFLEWHSHPVTKDIFGVLKERMEELDHSILNNAAFGEQRDLAYKSGLRDAYREFITITHEEFYGN